MPGDHRAGIPASRFPPFLAAGCAACRLDCAAHKLRDLSRRINPLSNHAIEPEEAS